MPIIKTTQKFIGLGQPSSRAPEFQLILVLGAIQSDVYIPEGNGGEWYIEVRRPTHSNNTVARALTTTE